MAERTYTWRPDTDAHLIFHVRYDDADPDAPHECVEVRDGGEPADDPQGRYERALAYNNATNIAAGGEPMPVEQKMALVGRRVGADGKLELDLTNVPARHKADVQGHLSRRFGAGVRHG